MEFYLKQKKLIKKIFNERTGVTHARQFIIQFKYCQPVRQHEIMWV